jgi:hypothetical protein
MTIGLEAIVSPIASALVVGLVSWVGVRVQIAKVTQRLDDRVAADTERHTEYCRRFDRIEKKAGISNGGADWVDRDFCREVHRGTSGEVAALRETQRATGIELVALREDVQLAARRADEAVGVAHNEAMAIKDRLQKVEIALDRQAR